MDWQPYILKSKSPLFYEHETKMLDTGAEDPESEESWAPPSKVAICFLYWGRGIVRYSVS